VWISGCGGSSKPISISITAASATVDGADTVTLTAAVTNDKNSAGVSWAVTSGGGTLSNESTTSATYTAPAPTSSSQTIIVTATSVAKTTQTGTITITVPAMPAVTSTSVNLTGAVGSTFSVQLQASGGIPPFTWALASGTTLPTCLTLKSNGTLTTVSGTAPTTSCAGSYTNLVFKATDSGTPNPLSVTSSPLTITIAAAPAVAFTGSVPATGTYGVAYSGSAAATGGAGALTYSIQAGGLPPDLSLSTSSGAITGTPSKAADVGTFPFTVQAADAYGDSNTQAYTLVITYPAVSVTTAALPTGYVGSAYTTTTLSATGGNGGPFNWTWAAASGSSLPAGLSLSATGAISGTPTTTGTYNVAVTATDSASNAGKATLSIVVKPGITINSITLPGGYAGSAYPPQGSSATLTASGGNGGPYTWSWAAASGSSLPAGMSIGSSSGTIGGTPTTPGTYSVVVTATDPASNSGKITLPLTIAAGVTVTAPALKAAYPGVAYASPAFTASGGTGTGFTWTMAAASGSSVPATFTMGSATGIISSASPVNTGSSNATYNVVVTATDSLGNTGSAMVTIIIEPALAIAPATLPSASVGVLYTQALSVSGGSGGGYAWSTTGANTLSNVGLSFSSATATVTGTPTLAEANQTGSFTAQVTDAEGHTAQTTYSITAYNQVTITTSSINPLDVGQSASQTLAAAGGSGNSANYSWSWTAAPGSSIPAGLSLSTGGAISGSPTATGAYTVVVKVTDSGTNTSNTQNFTITIYGTLSLPTPNPASLPGGYTNVSYSGDIGASGGSNSYCYSATGLPADGLSGPLNNSPCGYVASTFPVSGTPGSTPTTVTFTLKATDGSTGYSVSQTYTITITAPVAPSLPTPSGTVPGSGTSGQSYTASLVATGGVGPTYTWTVNNTTVSGTLALGASGLPSQFSVSNSGSSTLSITGSPSSTGTVTFTAQVKDNTTGLTSSTQNYSIVVNSAGEAISGQISPHNFSFCTSSAPSLPTISVALKDSGGNTVQTVSTDTNGNYSFTTVASGAYTITPSYSGPAGSSSLFYPAAQSVTVSNQAITSQNFQVSLAYTVSGSVSYSGSNHGQIYVELYTNCGATASFGTSITAAGNFTIHGASPGNYTLSAWMDPSSLNEGGENEADPASSVLLPTVLTANLSGQSLTLADPTESVPVVSPRIKNISPADQGVVISFGGGSVTGSDGKEIFTSYTVQWSTSSTSGFSSSNQAILKAAGGNANVWILHNGNANMSGTLSNGTAHYFKIWGSNLAGAGPSETTTTTVTPNPPAAGSGLYQVTGSITIPANVSINSGAPLYAGLYDEDQNIAYAAVISNPSNSTGNNFTVYVPASPANVPNYVLFGILDQNKDGVIDTGDDTNVNESINTVVAVSGNLTGQNATLPATNATTAVETRYTSYTSSGGTSTSYALDFVVREGLKLPVAVTLTGGPNVINPVDFTNYCGGCGNIEFTDGFGIGNDTRSVGDAYTFSVTYSDGTSDSQTANVTGWNGGASVAGAADIVTNMLPAGTTGPGAGTRTQPTFTWIDPSVDSGNLFEFILLNLSATSGTEIWQIPGSNANVNGFLSSVQSITWGVDPTDNTNLPTVTSLTIGDKYEWYVVTQDSNGNQAWTAMYYVP
jgi:hypothetical protein